MASSIGKKSRRWFNQSLRKGHVITFNSSKIIEDCSASSWKNDALRSNPPSPSILRSDGKSPRACSANMAGGERRRVFSVQRPPGGGAGARGGGPRAITEGAGPYPPTPEV